MTTKELIKKSLLLLGIFLASVGTLTQDNTFFLIGTAMSLGGASLMFLIK